MSGIASVVPLGITMYMSEVPEIGSERGTEIVSAAWKSQKNTSTGLSVERVVPRDGFPELRGVNVTSLAQPRREGGTR